ncbi:MAG: photosynthetic complex putative assembly protein PuhB [Rhodobacter sp.]|nr:photosynthetic complex putative assembly protein PuhB [Rhodobacter sp.]
MPHDDFAFEPMPGLPARPPKGEEVLWQGRPKTWALAREALGLYWVAGWFLLLGLWRVGAASTEVPFPAVLLTGLPLLGLGLVACGIILLIAWVQARSTVYTITTARVAMRIGAALTVTFNIPYRKIGSAGLDLRKSGTGTIALQTLGETRLSYLICWPHVRPWRMAKTQPALRCIRDAERVAQILADAAETRVGQPEITRIEPAAIAAE